MLTSANTVEKKEITILLGYKCSGKCLISFKYGLQ